MRIEDSVKLSRDILHWANRGLPRTDFLREVSNVLMDFTGCDAVEIRLSDGDLHYRWEAARRPESASSTSEPVHMEMAVAVAAPATPQAGRPKFPKISP